MIVSYSWKISWQQQSTCTSRKKGAVCPPQLQLGLFAVSTVNNLDHNASSTTATGSFHGTGISLFQYPTHGTAQRSNQTHGSRYKAMPCTPRKLHNSASSCTHGTFYKIANLTSATQSKPDTVAAGIHEEQHWLRQLQELCNKEKLEMGDAKPWSACHAALQASGRCILGNW